MWPSDHQIPSHPIHPDIPLIDWGQLSLADSLAIWASCRDIWLSLLPPHYAVLMLPKPVGHIAISLPLESMGAFPHGPANPSHAASLGFLGHVLSMKRLGQMQFICISTLLHRHRIMNASNSFRKQQKLHCLVMGIHQSNMLFTEL